MRILPFTRRFIHNLISKRQIFCRFGEVLINTSIDKISWTYWGLPQGNVLCPLLYSIYTYQLEMIVNKDYKILQYADDICIYSMKPTVQESLNTIECNFEAITLFWKIWNLLCQLTRRNSVSLITKTMHLWGNLILMVNWPRREFHIKVREKKINATKNVKFLSMIFQSDLGWSFHIKDVANCCALSIRTFRCLGKTFWGADFYLMLQIY